ncbi:isoprenyl transferase [Aestuariimicrobium ganziense]|uniref:isoprenyl transferase n=1 Tax=Aestuariimicrobium ganziense TaxID=2773677 RepID=UPI0019445710|nr:isoprenyl transferase [Aestuariimicrobium ganziense]
MSRWERFKEVVDRLHPSNLLYSTYEARLLAELDPDRLPRHVAVQADGNRRWAKLNAPHQPLLTGYRAGGEKIAEFCDWCDEVGIQVVTLWVLSTDNFKRSGEDEVGPILVAIRELVDRLVRHPDWRVKAVGDPSLLPDDFADHLREAEAATAGRAGMHINIAVGYGGRHELRDAVRSLLADESAKGNTLEHLAETLEIDQISGHLYTKGQPDPDLIIRTSGEQRMSGFLMWQSAHSEFYFCEALWPDFRKVDFIRALRSYAARERRYGR